jgi:hypothetical protein
VKRSADALPYTLYRADPGTKVQHIQHSNAAPARVFSEEELRSLAATYDEALTLARDAGRIASFPRFGITFLAFAASRLNRGSGPDNSDTNAKDRLFLLPGPCYENSQLDSVLGSWLSESTHLPSVAIVDAAVSGAQINLLTNTIKALAEKGCAMPQEVLVVAIAGQNERHRAKKGRTDQMWQVGGKTVRLVWLEPLNLSQFGSCQGLGSRELMAESMRSLGEPFPKRSSIYCSTLMHTVASQSTSNLREAPLKISLRHSSIRMP